MNDFKKVFISHRSYDREKAKKFRTFLLENNISEYCCPVKHKRA